MLASETLGALAETVAARGLARVVAVALNTAMHGLIGLDAGHRPLTPLLTLADSRATAEAAELRAAGAASALHRGSGTPVHPMSPLVKLTWFRRGTSRPWRSGVRTWVGLKDWILLALTATLAAELSSASPSYIVRIMERDARASAGRRQRR